MKHAPLRHRLEYAAFVLVRGALRALPHRTARAAGARLGSLAFHLDRRRRSTTLRNLALAYPEIGDAERLAWARACFRHFGTGFADVLSAGRFDRVEYCRRLTVEGWEHYDAARDLDRGVLIMSAHWGLWEAASQPLALYREGMGVVGRPADNPWLDRQLQRERERFGNTSIDKHGAARAMLRGLSDKKTVGILIDQRVQPREGIPVEFFGRPAWTSPILAKLSLRTGAPVVPIFGLPEGRDGWRVFFRPPIAPAIVSGLAEADRVAALTRRYLAAVEVEVRAAPALWLWLHDRWRGTPG